MSAGDDQLWASGWTTHRQGYLDPPIDPKQVTQARHAHKAFMIYVNVRLRRRAIRISSQMLGLN